MPHPKASGQLQSGDVVFQDSSPGNGVRAGAIKTLSRSKWSHCGIYFKRPGGAVVIEGNGRDATPTPWEKWKQKGAGQVVDAYRLNRSLTPAQVEALWAAARHYDGRPYDVKFAWGDGEIYCSELIWKAYWDALHVELSTPSTFGQFNLRSREARDLITAPGGWGTVEAAEAHSNEKVVSPQALTDGLVKVGRF